MVYLCIYICYDKRQFNRDGDVKKEGEGVDTRHIKIIDCRQLYYIHPVGGMDFNAKLISKMELLLPKLVGEGLALLLVTTMLL